MPHEKYTEFEQKINDKLEVYDEKLDVLNDHMTKLLYVMNNDSDTGRVGLVQQTECNKKDIEKINAKIEKISFASKVVYFILGGIGAFSTWMMYLYSNLKNLNE